MKPRTLSALAIAIALSTPTHAQAPSSAPVPATLADVAFMTGHWIGGEGGDLSEEIWSAPEGDSMLGMWRYVSKGQARIYELLTLTAAGPHVVLRIRHFVPKLVAREDKDRAVELRLVRKGPSEAEFAGSEYDGKGGVRLTYRGAADTLTGVLEKTGSKQEFRFRRR